MFLENFTAEKQWQQFVEYYRRKKAEYESRGGGSTGSLVADEDIWPFILSAFLKEFTIPVLVITSTLERACELENEINCIVPKVKILGFTSLGSSIFYKNKVLKVLVIILNG